MRKVASAAFALGLVISLSGCSGQSEETICKNYFKAYGDHLVTVMNGDLGAFEFANALSGLSQQASGELRQALISDSVAAPDGFQAAAICKKYLKD